MGASHSPADLLTALSKVPFPSGVNIVILGPPDLLVPPLFSLYPAQDSIFMTDHPVSAIKKKKDSSMLLGLRLLKQKQIDAFVSAGNTGALVLGAKIILSTLPKIHRPALLSLIPTKKKAVAVLDLGANIDCKTHHLIQFALLASAYLQTKGNSHPRIGLLNIGEESMKGTSVLRQAYQKLESIENAPFSFVGNIEGQSVFDGDVDALITDGFTGNVFLKTAEGITSLILDQLHAILPKETIAAYEAQLTELQRYLYCSEYSGALLIGLKGIVIKCHGYSTPEGFVSGVKGAISLVLEQFMDRFQKILESYCFTRFDQV